MISFVMPALNEEKRVRKTVETIKQEFPDSEVIVVDDASTDQTTEEARRAGARVLKNEKRIGFTPSVKKGVEKSKGSIIVKIDADGEIPIKHFKQAVDKIGEHDLVIGKKERFHRVSEKIVSYLTQFVTELPFGADVFPGLLVFKKNVYDQIGFDDANSWLFGFVLKACKNDYSVGLIPLSFKQREDSKVGYSLTTDLKLLISALRAFTKTYIIQ